MTYKKTKMMYLAAALLGVSVSGQSVVAGAAATGRTNAAAPHLFLDVHEIGPGKVNPQAVAKAHKLDLAAQGKFGVAFKSYWVDEKAGLIYCLAEAPSAEAMGHVHQAAHGLMATKTMEVSADSSTWSPNSKAKLYIDVHHLGAGKVDAQAVANAHKQDVAAQGKHHVRYLNYWFDAASGTVVCLSEAPSAEAAVAVHKEAHGLIPDTIGEVVEGR